MNPPQEDFAADAEKAAFKAFAALCLNTATNPYLWPTVGDATPKMHPEAFLLPAALLAHWPAPKPNTWPLRVPRSEEFLSPTLRDRIFEAALEFLAGIDLWTPEGRAYAAWRRGAWKQN